ncbi:Transcriptional regulator, GntR family [Rubellimicrobium mesophilum DSM 19309]|uniref:Transcriptional regulator, GntR family n=1 Tax=Rubellimicrobium mesophilum DSM 19309 TaxID=442562 RepID=A0A017HNV5_9RHOB|nr:GntR family transcriptional regulator [Rubellimicrobium mesophilum]EYD76026.1 Transcriptional regulator, GntR family [Rubellimicrobium mesophilum DSM 19309]
MDAGGTAGGLGALAAVGRETVQDRVYAQLRESLIHGTFDAGETFPAAEVAQRLGVSSMPVREALARLVSERALETTPGRRVRVPGLSRARARDLRRARLLIEGDLARRALPNLTAADLDGLERLTRDYEAATDLRALARLNHGFHFGLYARAGSTVLLPMVESLWMQAGPYVRAAQRLHSPLTDPSATLHHRGILQAARTGDEGAMLRELEADVARTFAILERTGDGVWDDSEGAAA